MSLFHFVVLAPFLMAVILPFFYYKFRSIHTGWFLLPLPLVLFLYIATYIPFGGGGMEPVIYSVPWVPSLGIDFTVYIDGLSLLFGLLITGIGTLVVLYSIYYIANKQDEPLQNFYVYLLMFMGAMLGVVFSDNLIVLYVFWELTSLSSSLLIAYWFHKEKSRYGAQKSMLITVSGGFAMLAGFAMLYVIAGSTFSIQEMISQAGTMVQDPLILPAMLLVLAGAFTKSAQFPFHIWLPDAMEAPTPVSAYLHSATMVKAGIYLVARTTPIFGLTQQWFWILVIFGLVTLTWGSISAVRQTDLKGILAFSTVSQLGLIMSLLGMASAALHFEYVDQDTMYVTAAMAAVFHLINHATFKGSLFMAVGIIDHETGTRDVRLLGGLMTIMPVTFTISLIGLAAMAGLPPFNGFLSKELFFTASLNAASFDIFNLQTLGFIIPVFAWIASVFTFVYSMMMFLRTFTGAFKPDNYEKHVHEAPWGLLISPIVLGSLVILFGLFPNMLAYTIIEPAMQSILPGLTSVGDQFYVNIYHWHGINAELLMTIGVVLFGLAVALTLPKLYGAGFFQRERDPLNAVYDTGLDQLVVQSQNITKAQMTGRLRDYMLYMGVFIAGLGLFTLFRYDALAISLEGQGGIPIYVWLVTGVLLACTLALPFVSGRMTNLILLGAVGFLIALLFVILRAPDLALTQLLVETVMVVLILLSFRHLPEMTKESKRLLSTSAKAVVSIAVGTFVTLTALSVHAYRSGADITPISDYFVENSKTLAGGYNMVNVILVDFRGLDTLLEVLVLGVAALGIVTMIKLRMRGGEDV
ncbi:Na+/H+ antiporter subunit A [Alkalicoccus urumqiensis]|uniref:Na+/H+ antiporter subunit A n=1 Tax=Alkalicoccus urumqiensis TaxID=1548213 RepID=A0A2P6MFN6_ALKUR|nr:Na+/H+ antiporter subunit A [Alkalicoccus urumqiensis]PRO65073.1 Na+/H+ antiporter subunit A [Alkalicoccus urumqiensis]